MSIPYTEINTLEKAVKVFEKRMIPSRMFSEFKKIQPELASHPKILVLALHNGLDFSEVEEEDLTFEIVKNVILYHPNKYSELPLKYRSNVELSLMCAEFDGSLMAYAPVSIKNNKEVVLAAIKSKPSCIAWFPSRITSAIPKPTHLDRNDYSVGSVSSKFKLHV